MIPFSNACAEQQDQPWNWYYAAFYSPTIGSKILVRSGTAKIKLTTSEIAIKFSDIDQPELKASFEGKIVRPGNLSGVLKGFFPSGSEHLVGTYREMGTIKECRWQEVVLKPNVPDGSALVLSRIQGKCQ